MRQNKTLRPLFTDTDTSHPKWDERIASKDLTRERTKLVQIMFLIYRTSRLTRKTQVTSPPHPRTSSVAL